MRGFRNVSPNLVLAAAVSLLAARPASGQLMPVGSEFRVNNFLGNSKNYPRIAVANGGSFQVVWRQGSPGSTSEFVRRFSSTGAPIGNEGQLNSSPTASSADIASLSSAGAFVVVYASNTPLNGAGALSATIVDSAGTPGAEFRVDTYTTDASTKVPSVAADSAGNFVVVWTGFPSPTPRHVIGQRYNAAGTPVGGNFTVFQATTFNENLSHARVALSAQGDFVVTWAYGLSGAPSDYDVVARRYSSSGSPLGAVFQVNTYTTGEQYWSNPSMDAAGDFVVTWGARGSSDLVKARRFSASGVGGAEFQVSSVIANDVSVPPGIATDPSGHFVIAWSGGLVPMGFSDVIAREFDTSTNFVGSEFKVNTYTTYSQYRPSVGVDGLGHYIVVWMNQTDHEVYGQRYCATGTLVTPPLPITTTQTLCQ